MVIIRTDTSPELWQIVLDVLVALGRVGAVVVDAPVRPCRPRCRLRYRLLAQALSQPDPIGLRWGRDRAVNVRSASDNHGRGIICPTQQPSLAEHRRPRLPAYLLSHGGRRSGTQSLNPPINL